MQHDGTHGPAIDGGPRYLRDDSTGKDFIVLHGGPTLFRALGTSSYELPRMRI
jgi:hypothetical protein